MRQRRRDEIILAAKMLVERRPTVSIWDHLDLKTSGPETPIGTND
jgi:hypothetical protein